MSALASRPASAAAQLERLTESGALDPLWWALTDCLLSAAQQIAPEAETPAEAAWIVAGRADSSLQAPAGHRRPLGAGDQPTMHEAVPTPASTRDGFAEDSHRDCLTPAAD